MTNAILSTLLAAQLMLSGAVCVPADCPGDEPRTVPLWWGLIDPELSLWFAHLPMEKEQDERILWDWSWRGFLGSLFSMIEMKGVPSDAASA